MIKYSEMKDSGIEWIGEIPSHWETRRGKFLFNSKKEVNRDLECQNLLSLTLLGVLNKDFDSSDGLRPQNYNTYQIFHENDLVFKMIDLENVKTSRVGIVHETGIMSPVYLRHEPILEKIDPRFSYWFYYDLYQKEIYNSIGSGVRSSLSSSDLLELELPTPPLEEQKRISKYLDQKTEQIDSLIEKIEKKIELLKEQRTSLINQCVTKGLDPNVEMKDSGIEWIGEIPSHWETKKLKHIVSNKGLIRGPFGGALKVDTFVPQGYKVYEQKNAIYNDFTLGTSFINEEKFEELNRFSIMENDILMSCSGTIGKTALVPKDVEPGIINQALLIIRIQTALNILPEYIQTLFSSSFFQEQVIDNSQGGAMKNLVGIDIFRNVKIPLPNQTEQTNILKNIKIKCSVLDKRIDTELKRIELLKEYRQSLISSVVTGKVRVTEEMV